MACGCSDLGNFTPQSNPWAPPAQALIPVVFDPNTNTTRPLAFGEVFPGTGCSPCSQIDSVLPSAKHMQDAYFDLQRRLVLLERKYCECVCSGAVEPPEQPVQVPDSWQSNVVTITLSGEEG